MEKTDFRRVYDEVREKSESALLLAVSKNFPYEAVLDAYSQGARFFGENRVQEAQEKYPMDRPEDMHLFLIGHLQRNKAKRAVQLFDRIESLDSLEIIDRVMDEAERISKSIEVLIEYNSSGEESKSGFKCEEDLIKGLEEATESERISIKGIMTIGPLTDDKERIKASFLKTKRLFDSLKDEYGLSVLSMGMSGDWRLALECGSTEVRIGTLIFGKRR